jgi:hypothetical protein
MQNSTSLPCRISTSMDKRERPAEYKSTWTKIGTVPRILGKVSRSHF